MVPPQKPNHPHTWRRALVDKPTMCLRQEARLLGGTPGLPVALDYQGVQTQVESSKITHTLPREWR